MPVKASFAARVVSAWAKEKGSTLGLKYHDFEKRILTNGVASAC